jgi:SPP1 family predicted phage head-tail adaptor
MNEIAILVQQIQTTDEYGDPTVAEVQRSVFCREASIGQKEFYQAHAVGLQPEIKLVLADYLDYNGEQLVRYAPKGQTYPQLFRVLRTYRTGQELELVIYREVNPA